MIGIMSNKENVDDIKKTIMTDDIIIRLSGQGQYRVSKEIAAKIDSIDDSIVNILQNTNTNVDNVKVEKELREKIMEIVNLIISGGKQLQDKEIVQSSIIIPSPDISIEEAKMIFKGEGVIPDI